MPRREANGQAVRGSRAALIAKEGPPGTVTLVAVTDVLPAGSQWVGVACNQVYHDISMPDVRIAAVALSDG